MTDKQPEALRLADELLEPIEGFPSPTTLEKNTAALLRTQHATIESMTVVLDGQHADLLRKDALLRKCMKHVASNISMTSDGTEAEDLYDAIKEELQ